MNDVIREGKIKKFVGVLSAALLLCVFLVLFVFGTGKRENPPIVGMILLGNKFSNDWDAPQYKAMETACRERGVTLLVRDNVRGDCSREVDELVREGAEMIFLSSFDYTSSAQSFVKRYPQVSFITNATEHRARNMTPYYVRLYEGRYLAGMIAGMKTKTNTIGYVAAMFNSEVNRDINAFALGVQRVNKSARVVVMWTDAWQDPSRERDHTRQLVQRANADVITYHQDESAAAEAAEAMGVDYIGFYQPLPDVSPHNLTSVVCHWENYYPEIMDRYLRGEINSPDKYWMGMEDGVIDLSSYSPLVTAEMKAVVEIERNEILKGKFIFSGPIYDREGNLRVRENENISDDALLNHIDWLVRGVETLEGTQ